MQKDLQKSVQKNGTDAEIGVDEFTEPDAEFRAGCRAVIMQMPAQNLMQILVQMLLQYDSLIPVQSSVQIFVQKCVADDFAESRKSRNKNRRFVT